MLLFKDKPFWFELGIYDIKGLSKTKTKIYFLCMYNSNVSNLIYINIIDMDQRSKHYWKYLKLLFYLYSWILSPILEFPLDTTKVQWPQ